MAEADAPERAAFAGENGIATQLGGVLFLINLLCALDLPDCFEDDWRLASALGPWGTLAALGRGLLADDGARWCDDGLWPALAALDSREPHAPLGAALTLPDVARLPETWADWLGKTDTRTELALPDGPLTAPLASPLRRWLALVLPALRRRLIGALGLSSAVPDLVAALLVQPGWLYCSALHVDLVLPLAAIDLPTRLAGLDRDPGWLPAFGRVVKFHFV